MQSPEGVDKLVYFPTAVPGGDFCKDSSATCQHLEKGENQKYHCGFLRFDDLPTNEAGYVEKPHRCRHATTNRWLVKLPEEEGEENEE